MRMSVALLLAMGCTAQPMGAAQDLNAPPVVDPDEMLLESGLMSPGEVFTMTVTDATPGDPVHFYYTVGGLGVSQPQPNLGGLQLDLRRPRLVPGINPAVADANGEAFISFTIPPRTQSGFVAGVQAAVEDGAASYVSNPLVVEVDGCAEDENEDDDDPSTANIVQGFELWHGRSCGSDLDWYAIDVPAGKEIYADIEFDHINGDLDLFLFDGAPTDLSSLYNEAVVIADSTTDDEIVTYTAPHSTTVYLAVLRYSDGLNGPGNNYDMHFVIDNPEDVYADEPAVMSPADLRADFDAARPGVLPPLMDSLIEDFLAVEDAILNEDFVAARAAFDAINMDWSDPTWLSTGSWGRDLNVGSPVGYYGLRMMEEIIDWRENNPASDAEPVHMSVMLPGCSQGIQPTSQAELTAGTGVAATELLDPAVQADNHRIIRQSLRLFRRYMEAASEGTLRVEIEIVDLPDLCLDVNTQVSNGTNWSFPVIGDALWDEIPEEIVNHTDWWWLVYPSMLPNQYPDFTNTEFVTGGQTYGPGGAPLIVGDDRWLTDIPPHLGAGEMTDLERRMYLPQWLQHEFFHFLFAVWPQFGLEDQGHQWFNRSTWPADFVGSNEPDYYAEALHKRLQGATPPMATALRFDQPDPYLFTQLTAADLIGEYMRVPTMNDWHIGDLSQTTSGWRWDNAAGVGWGLTLDTATGTFIPAPGAPYGDEPFYIKLERHPTDGGYIPSVEALRFLNEAYEQQ